MLLQILLFLVGLWMLIKGGDWFVDSASEIARRFHLPELLIGATVVSIGTTLPEVMVSAQGAMAGSGGMAYGNAIGSIICNTALIAAITVAIKPGKVDRKALVLPITFFFAAALFYVVVAYFFGEFARWVGIVLLCGFVAYMIAILLGVKGEKEKGIVEVPHEEPDFSKNSSFSIFGFLLGYEQRHLVRHHCSDSHLSHHLLENRDTIETLLRASMLTPHHKSRRNYEVKSWSSVLPQYLLLLEQEAKET